MIKFEKFFLNEVTRLSGIQTTSLSKLELIGQLTTESRVKKTISLFLFFKEYKKESKLTKYLKVKYKYWSNLEKAFKTDKNSFNEDFKILKNYELHINLIKKQQQTVMKVYEESQRIRTKDLAGILGVSVNVASAFKRGEVKRISPSKVIMSAKQIIKTK